MATFLFPTRRFSNPHPLSLHSKSMQTSSMTLQTQRVQMVKMQGVRKMGKWESGKRKREALGGGVVSCELFRRELCQRNKHKTGSRFLRVRPLKSLTFKRASFSSSLFLLSHFCNIFSKRAWEHSFLTFFAFDVRRSLLLCESFSRMQIVYACGPSLNAFLHSFSRPSLTTVSPLQLSFN